MTDENEDKCECGMPLDDKTRCTCKHDKCVHCCGCEDDCECGCKKKSEESEEE